MEDLLRLGLLTQEEATRLSHSEDDGGEGDPVVGGTFFFPEIRLGKNGLKGRSDEDGLGLEGRNVGGGLSEEMQGCVSLEN